MPAGGRIGARARHIGRRRKPVPPQDLPAGVSQYKLDERQSEFRMLRPGKGGDGILRCRIQVQWYPDQAQRVAVLVGGSVSFVDKSGVHLAQGNLLRNRPHAGLMGNHVGKYGRAEIRWKLGIIAHQFDGCAGIFSCRYFLGSQGYGYPAIRQVA